MAERGATPQVSPVRRKALNAVRSLFSPLLPDDYLELINPLWSTRELRGRVEQIRHETRSGDDRDPPGHEWPGHRPAVRARGVVVDGVFHWRAYSLTSDPAQTDRCISITPKLVEGAGHATCSPGQAWAARSCAWTSSHQLGRDADAAVGLRRVRRQRVRPPVEDAVDHDPHAHVLAGPVPGHSWPGRITIVAASGVSCRICSTRPRSSRVDHRGLISSR